MTAVPKDPRISELRELFRYLQEFRATYEDTGVDELRTPLGDTWSLWDLEYLYAQTHRLSIRQQQAISLCLIHNIREKDAARMMGVSVTNPVMMYATLGLRKLLDMVEAGELNRFHRNPMGSHALAERRNASLHRLADHIKSLATLTTGDCWAYPTPTDRPCRVPIRSRLSSSGLIHVHPLTVMYEAYIGSIPQHHLVEHKRSHFKAAIACVNPEHGILVLTEERKRRNALLLDRYLKTQEQG